MQTASSSWQLKYIYIFFYARPNRHIYKPSSEIWSTCWTFHSILLCWELFLWFSSGQVVWGRTDKEQAVGSFLRPQKVSQKAIFLNILLYSNKEMQHLLLQKQTDKLKDWGKCANKLLTLTANITYLNSVSLCRSSAYCQTTKAFQDSNCFLKSLWSKAAGEWVGWVKRSRNRTWNLISGPPLAIKTEWVGKLLAVSTICFNTPQ